MKRRSFLKGTLATGTTAVAVNAGLLIPSTALAVEDSEWNSKAFSSSTLDDALLNLFDSNNATLSGDIKLKAPSIAENGAVTPITVDATAIDGVESIVILATKNPTPLVCEYTFSSGTPGFVATRIKLRETMNVVAIVKANGKLLKAEQEVKVTVGGCGG